MAERAFPHVGSQERPIVNATYSHTLYQARYIYLSHVVEKPEDVMRLRVIMLVTVVCGVCILQAVEDVSKGRIDAGEQLTQLKTLKAQDRKQQV